VNYRQRNRDLDQWGTIKTPEIDTHSCRVNSFLTKAQGDSVEKKNTVFHKWFWTNKEYLKAKIPLNPYLLSQRSKLRLENIKFFKAKTEKIKKFDLMLDHTKSMAHKIKTVTSLTTSNLKTFLHKTLLIKRKGINWDKIFVKQIFYMTLIFRKYWGILKVNNK
jgi:hypothetical protein